MSGDAKKPEAAEEVGSAAAPATPGAFEVEIQSLVVRSVEPRIRATDYASVELQGQLLPPNAKFYIGISPEGVLLRCVTIGDPDRRDVAALVGNWIASGLVVKGCGRRELIRYLRRAEKLDPSVDE